MAEVFAENAIKKIIQSIKRVRAGGKVPGGDPDDALKARRVMASRRMRSKLSFFGDGIENSVDERERVVLAVFFGHQDIFIDNEL